MMDARTTFDKQDSIPFWNQFPGLILRVLGVLAVIIAIVTVLCLVIVPVFQARH